MKSLVTTVVLTLSKPARGRVTIVTLNSDEENATVQAVLLGDVAHVKQVSLVSPEPHISKIAVALAESRLDQHAPEDLRYLRLGYWELLRQYRLAETTYSTHVLLPGRDLSRRRRHVHLTHGSGPKPDTTFRAPTNVLASITPQWVPDQLREYKLPATTEVIHYMPRLEVMRRAVGDRTVPERLGLDPARKFVVWAPTYRASRRSHNEVRVSGTELSDVLCQRATRAPADLSPLDEAKRRGWELVIKVHPHDSGTFEAFEVPVVTNLMLRKLKITPYEVFGAADLVITDYSSVSSEREELGLHCTLWRPDFEEFLGSYRGLRNVRSE